MPQYADLTDPGYYQGDPRASNCGGGKCRHGHTGDQAHACKEGLKKGPPFWLAPIPKREKIKEYHLPYLGGWTPRDGKAAWARLQATTQ